MRIDTQRTVPARLERSMLFVPASRWSMIQKAAASAADSVCLDLEDAVVVGEKEASRANVVRAFKEMAWGHRLRMFRINGLDTAFAYRDLIEVVEAAGDMLDLVMVPKVNRPEDLVFVDILLTQIEEYHGFTRRTGIAAQIETAAGYQQVQAIARASPRLEMLMFGAGDYAASMRMPLASIGEFDEHDQIYPGHRWHAVMHAIVAAARANGLRCLDGPFAGLHDPQGYERACRIARAMGFDGKGCIHPNQLATANQIFAPSEPEISWAQAVIAACEQAAAAGHGAVSIDGKMIDAASLRVAQVIVAQARLVTEREPGA